MKKKLGKITLTLSICLSLMFSNTLTAFATDSVSPQSESSIVITDQSIIQAVQEILNHFGYDCGTADGIVGQKTQDAVKAYQKEQGLQETGQITQEVVNQLASGVPLNVFTQRFNEAVDLLNNQQDVTEAPIMQHVDFNETDESYVPNGNLTISLNPNLTDRKTIGNINIGSTDEYFDVNLSMVEVAATIYAFDYCLVVPNDAIVLVNELFDTSDGTLKKHEITFDNYSFPGMLLFKATYDAFSITDSSTTDETVQQQETSDSSENGTQAPTQTAENIEQDETSNSSENDIQEPTQIDVSNEEILSIFDVTSIDKLTDLTELVGVTSDIFSEKAGITFDNKHLSGTRKELRWYDFNGNLGIYNGKYCITVNSISREIGRISFSFYDGNEPLPRESLFTEINKLAQKNPYETLTSETSTQTTDRWSLNNCKIELLSYDINDDMHPGVSYVGFTPFS